MRYNPRTIQLYRISVSQFKYGIMYHVFNDVIEANTKTLLVDCKQFINSKWRLKTDKLIIAYMTETKVILCNDLFIVTIELI